MNVFYTNRSPVQSAREHCRVHVNKMILEYSQLLSTAHRVIDGDEYAERTGLYRKTHVNHPSAVWCRESEKHYEWLYDCLLELHSIYTSISGKVHASSRLLDPLSKVPGGVIDRGFVAPTPAMPDEYRCGDVDIAYQNYLSDKFFEWQSRDKPVKVEFPCGVPNWYFKESIKEAA